MTAEASRRWRKRHPEKSRACFQSWRNKYPEHALAKMRRYRRKTDLRLKLQVIKAYGGKCSCSGCNEDRWEFMTIDHIEGGGQVDRAKFGNTAKFYRFLRNNCYPKDKYRLLCFNCNSSRGAFGYCSHQGLSLDVDPMSPNFATLFGDSDPD